MKPLLVLRPEPGASKTASKARALGMDPVVRPLFEVRPLAWDVEVSIPYDALFITSSNALKFKHDALEKVHGLPVLCVGEATADAARSAGFADVTSGCNDARSLADLAASLGYRRLLWLAGQSSTNLEHPDLIFDVRYVYETPALELCEADLAQLNQPAVVLLHSPRAAHRFAELVADKSQTVIVTISEKAAMAAGPGWAEVRWPSAPTDDGMLELAAPLCRAG